MRVNLNTEKGATDRRLAHIFFDYKSIVQFVSLGRLLLWFITIFTECVSGTKAGDAEAHYCNEIHNTHSTVMVAPMSRL